MLVSGSTNRMRASCARREFEVTGGKGPEFKVNAIRVKGPGDGIYDPRTSRKLDLKMIMAKLTKHPVYDAESSGATGRQFPACVSFLSISSARAECP